MSPVREPSNHSFSFTGRIPSLKMKRMISFESTLEKDLIYLLDYDQRVSYFEEQPLRIEYRLVGKRRLYHYTPDFHVIVDGQNWLYECKPDRYIDTDENQQKFEAARRWCLEREWKFLVVNDKILRSGYCLQNVKYLTSFARFIVKPDLRVEIATCLCLDTNPITIGDVIAKVKGFDRTQILPAIFQMAYFHEIEISVDLEPISPNSLVKAVLKGAVNG
jgi:hypothetical protein